MYRGVCVIPIKRKKLSEGLVYELIDDKNLGAIIDYSNKKGLYVVYLSESNGIVYYDSYIKERNKRVKKNKLWSVIIGEQIFRLCFSYSVTEVYLMNTSRYEYKILKEFLRHKGLRVYNPIEGYKEDSVFEVLRVQGLLR